MPYDKVLVRLDEENNTRTFVPTMESHKGYITEFIGDGRFQEVSLTVYRSTRDAPLDVSRRKFKEFLKSGARKPARLALRLPKDFQKAPRPGSYHLVANEGLFIVEDSQKVLHFASPDKSQAIARLRELTRKQPP